MSERVTGRVLGIPIDVINCGMSGVVGGVSTHGSASLERAGRVGVLRRDERRDRVNPKPQPPGRRQNIA